MQGASFGVFISHIHEEEPVASKLREWLESSSHGELNIFIGGAVPLGKQWLQETADALKSSRLVISLLSPFSLPRMWIHLETGWAQGHGIDVLPVCHSGLTCQKLPIPYSEYQGVDIAGQEFGRNLLSTLSLRTGTRDPTYPSASSARFEEEIRKLCQEVSRPKLTGRDREILKLIDELVEAEKRLLNARQIADAFHTRPGKMESRIQHLVGAGLIVGVMWGASGTCYALTQEGKAYLAG